MQLGVQSSEYWIFKENFILDWLMIRKDLFVLQAQKQKLYITKLQEET